ncbi:Rossmann-fold NAD(P)-binding domain-containing protein [Phaeacidiphilus oryzae]|uniref:NAD-dependent epimerase n=1 Tax=Phaeacidiphilus oryzae TaxID=348818 RepID=UPI000AEBE80F|nr:NAD-dependent epimerase [Phaeacidiphilus oryzae]
MIGGSVFLGRAFAAEALARGWQVTTFNRGRSAPDLPGVRALRGDREDAADLDALAAAGPYDAVVDVCGYTPSTVGASLRALGPVAPAYLFVSSISACRGWPAETVDESSERWPCKPDAGPEDGDYGVLKAGCERAVEEYFPGRSLILAPGLIIGPGDPTGRATWWLERAARGGPFLAPGGRHRPIQLIDARDIAAFGLDRIADGDEGRWLTTSQQQRSTWEEFLAGCAAAVASTGRAPAEPARPVWVEDGFLLDHDVEVWNELPLWAPAVPEMDGVWNPDASRALAAGLTPRPLADSLRDAWAWLDEPSGDNRRLVAEYARGKQAKGLRPAGMDPEREEALLAEWAGAAPVAGSRRQEA